MATATNKRTLSRNAKATRKGAPDADELGLDVELRVLEAAAPTAARPLRAPSALPAARYQTREDCREDADEDDETDEAELDRQSGHAAGDYDEADWRNVAAARRQTSTAPACDASQRLEPADRRRQLCFRFEFRPQLSRLIATRPQQPHANPPEQLVEAELHVFKLFPLVGRRNITTAPSDGRPGRAAQGDAQRRPANNLARSLYHLKTNLLEVSIYQVLPSALQEQPPSGGGGARSSASATPPPPPALRLLDIRRIDLDSSGWETFYVKRAVEDWLRDSKSNLGLVIEAKSMFDEPLEIGLIRFADAFDHTATEGASQEDVDFDAAHQPLLVIYTTTPPTARVAPAGDAADN